MTLLRLVLTREEAVRFPVPCELLLRLFLGIVGALACREAAADDDEDEDEDEDDEDEDEDDEVDGTCATADEEDPRALSLVPLLDLGFLVAAVVVSLGSSFLLSFLVPLAYLRLLVWGGSRWVSWSFLEAITGAK